MEQIIIKNKIYPLFEISISIWVNKKIKKQLLIPLSYTQFNK